VGTLTFIKRNCLATVSLILREGFCHPAEMKCIVRAAVIGTAVLLAGCNKPAPPPAPAESASAYFVPTAAQPKLPSIKLWLGPEELDAEMALTPIQEATGMMFRTNLAENAGMIFVQPQPEQASYWMTNCPLPLAAAYIDPEGTILEIHELKSNDPTPVLSASDNVQFVLEVNSHWFDRHHIAAGTLLSTEHGSLPEVFLHRR
jgi:uncharacterized membrane protein (UPF0127 family)